MGKVYRIEALFGSALIEESYIVRADDGKRKTVWLNHNNQSWRVLEPLHAMAIEAEEGANEI